MLMEQFNLFVCWQVNYRFNCSVKILSDALI